MTGLESGGISFWWLIPIIMMVFCFFMMRGKWRSGICTIRPENKHRITFKDSAMDILRKRYALGEIDQKEYEEKKEILMNRE